MTNTNPAKTAHDIDTLARRIERLERTSPETRYNGITGTLRDAWGDDAYPVTLTLSNGRTLTGVPYYVDGEEAVAISTAYKRDGSEVWVDPDVPPTHVALQHVVTARWTDA